MKGYVAVMYDSLTDTVKVEVREGKPGLAEMQTVVDGYIETLTRMQSPFRKNITFDAYVNEEGLLIGLPMTFTVFDRYGLRPFAGNVVIVGGNEATGDTVALNDKELEEVKSRFNPETGVLDFETS